MTMRKVHTAFMTKKSFISALLVNANQVLNHIMISSFTNSIEKF